ncbi:MAG: imidazole glycerol phosphate synthase subunit HisH [Lacunisphaera sp.]
MLAIVDSGGANIASVRFALERLGVQSELTADPAVIRSAERVILPGVGSAQEGMKRLQAKGLVDCVRGLKQPVLGVCLGMQLLFESSEEGATPSLGLIPGKVALLPESPASPCRTWAGTRCRSGRTILCCAASTPTPASISSTATPAPVNEFTLASCAHGTAFAAVVRRGNFWGAQFHPERSGAAGARLLKNFLEVPA